MVMQAMAKPRETHILVRGQYDKFGDQVFPNTPAALPPMPANKPNDRLGLARWIVESGQSVDGPRDGRIGCGRASWGRGS